MHAVLAALETVSDEQDWQMPPELEYLPAVHNVQGPPPGPVYPALHVHPVTEVLLAGDVVEVGHAVHPPPAGP